MKRAAHLWALASVFALCSCGRQGGAADAGGQVHEPAPAVMVIPVEQRVPVPQPPQHYAPVHQYVPPPQFAARTTPRSSASALIVEGNASMIKSTPACGQFIQRLQTFITPGDPRPNDAMAIMRVMGEAESASCLVGSN